MKKLIVTADDFGAAREVNEAVEMAHRDGILTAASLMVGAPAASDAAELAKRTPGLRVGLHVVLVEGRPMSSPSQIPDLIDSAGMFRTDMAATGAKMFFFPRVRRQIEYEIEAQFEAFRATGLALDHVNAHKHFHLHPTIASAILRIGKKFGMRALRVPREPRAIIKKLNASPSPPQGERVGVSGTLAQPSQLSENHQPSHPPPYPNPLPQGGRGNDLVAPFASLLINRVRSQGIAAPDHVFGLRWSGAMTAARLKGLLGQLPDGLSEIYLHPATGPYPGSAPLYRYAEELAALTDPQVVSAAREPGFQLGGFSDFL